VLPAGKELTEADYASWCGWHNDHGSLTSLVPAMYFNAEGKEVPAPDQQAGLYIRSRQGKIVKALMPGANTLGFQMGEAQQIHSGGYLMATPHCVMVRRLSIMHTC
jgi:isopenicillin N synthase-like dioxygenase